MAWPQTQRSARPSAVPDPARPFGSSTDPHSCHAHGRPVQLPPSSSAFLGEGFVRKSKEGQDEEHAVVGFLGGRGRSARARCEARVESFAHTPAGPPCAAA